MIPTTWPITFTTFITECGVCTCVCVYEERGRMLEKKLRFLQTLTQAMSYHTKDVTQISEGRSGPDNDFRRRSKTGPTSQGMQT